MSSVLLNKTACTSPNCNSSDAMQLYQNEDGTITGYCHVCKHFDPNPTDTGGVSAGTGNHQPSGGAGGVDKLNQVHSYGQADLSTRGILPVTTQYFGVKQDPGSTRHYYPYFKGNDFKGYKERVVATKDFFAVGDQKVVDLFGQHLAMQAQNHRLLIVEGEMDALAAWQMLWEFQQKNKSADYKDQLPSVVSLAHGSGATHRDCADQEEFFARFKDIVLVMDQDKAGKEAEQDLLEILPIEKVKVAKLSEKDANDMLLKGKAKEFCQEVLFKAQPWRPSTIRSVREAYKQATAMPKYGASLPFSTLSNAIQGVNGGDMIGVAAGVGIGKSTFWHKTISHHAHVNNEKCGVCFLEEDIGDTLKNMATHEAHKRFISAEGGFTQLELENAIDKLDGKVVLFEHDYHSLRDKSPWDAVKSAIRHMVLVEGCKHIVVDPLTALVAQQSSSEANDTLNHIMAEMEAMTSLLDFTFYYGAHLNAPKQGTPHEEGGRVCLSQLTGSKAMIKWSHVIIGIERNTQAPTQEEKNTSTIRLLKGRKLGNLIDFQVYFDGVTGSYEEIQAREAPAYQMGTNIQQPGVQ